MVLAGLLVVWAVAWSVPSGRISADTKIDLYVDPWGFLAASLHVWDSQVTWGGLQNQGVGYLFPMGPFFGVGSSLLPVWVVQRLWWMTLLTAGFLAMLGLLRALDVGSPRIRIVAALTYSLAPRVLSTIGGLSSEAQPHLLAPAILWPLVLVHHRVLGVRKGAALSGLAILCCGGVNATATLLAIVPAGLWLVTRSRWWRSSLTWAWSGIVVAATSWWLVPLVVQGRYSPPFLDWIESAQTVTAQITMLDVLRGTTHWLGHLVTAAGEWWPAGYQLVASPGSIMATTGLMALGLAGFALRRLPHRTFLGLCLASGVLLIAVPHRGSLDSPLSGWVQEALDGPLSPLRNVHKADLLIRLPLTIGLAHLLDALTRWRPRREWWRQATFVPVVLLVVAAAAPGFSGAIAPRGSFVDMAAQWREVGTWLDTRHDGSALIVPASSFGEYVWGRTMDEPLRPLTSIPYAVRDAVPLTPAGTIRLLDEVETRLETGRSLAGATTMLRAAGVRYLILRNDLAAAQAGQPPVALARSALVNTPDAVFVRGFGTTILDGTGGRVQPVEVYALSGRVAGDVEIWDAADVVGASGATEDLARLADGGVGGDAPIIFDGDRTSHLEPAATVVTDGFRARQRWFGAPRGQDVTTGLTEQEARGSTDYFPWPEVDRRTVVVHTGVRDVRASSSIASDFGVAGLQPAYRPFAAIDASPSTAWVTALDEDPTLTIELEEAADVDRLTVRPFADRVRFGKGLGVATEITVRTDQGSIDAQLEATGGATTIELPEGPTKSIRVHIRATTGGKPSEVVTGLSEVTIPGIDPMEILTTPSTSAVDASGAVLGAGLPGRNGCALLEDRFTCFYGQLLDPEATGPMVREVRGLAAGEHYIKGVLAIDPRRPPSEFLTVPGVTVSTSSARGYAPAALPVAIVDSDRRTAWSPSPDDKSPRVTITLDTAITVEGIRLQTRGEWAKREAPAVVVEVDDKQVTQRLPEHGLVTIPPTTGRTVTVTFIPTPGRGRPGMGALELEEVEFLGHDFALPAQEVSAACGQGPRLSIDGRTVDTSVTAPRSALFGLGEVTWSACGPVAVGVAESHRITLEPWRDLPARSVVLTPVRERASAVPVTLDPTREGPTRMQAEVAMGPQRLLVLAQNANAGWEADLEGRRLEAQVVDGRRQGFVIPDGAAGRLTITFAPDEIYRWGLGSGALLALVVVLLALWPGRRARIPLALPRSAQPRRPAVLALWSAVVIWCAVIAGPAGAVVGVLAIGAVVVGGRWPVRVPAIVALALAAALLQTVFAPGRVGGSTLEGAVRLLVIAAFAIALSVQESPGER